MIARDSAAEGRLYDALRDSFGSDQRLGIHLSSLLNPRQTHFRRLDPRPLTDDEIGYFTAGRGHEDIITRLLASDFESTPEEEIDGIHLRPDFVAVTDRVIPKGCHAELKTRRSNLPKTDQEAGYAFKSYLDQVHGYMALKRQETMYLIVLSLTEGKTGDPLSKSRPVIAVYKVTLSELELAKIRKDLHARKTLLEIGNVAVMPLCWEFLCVKWVKRELLKKCPYYDQCKPYDLDPKRKVNEPASDDLESILLKSIDKVKRERPEQPAAEASGPGIRP